MATDDDPLEPGEVREYDSFEDAYAALYHQLEPGATLVIHDGECALVDDEDECDCEPTELTKGYEA